MLKLEHIHLQLGNFSLQDINLSVRKGSYCVLLGESGSGKTLILNTIAGLYKVKSGKIILNNKEITFEKIQNRKVGLLFQDYAIFPHLTVFQNIAFPLKIQKFPKKEIMLRVMDLADEMSITNLLQRKPSGLSGGELQRVALARILAFNPEVLLLDEPLSSLDVTLRNDLRNTLRNLNRKGITIVHVTHDFEEALALARHIAVIHQGKIIQQGGPAEVFRNPNSPFVAHFSGVKNFFKVEINDDNQATIGGKIEINIPRNTNLSKSGYILIRGEEIILSREKPDSSAVNNFLGKVKLIVMNQYGYEVVVDIGRDIYSLITTQSAEKLQLKEGCELWVSFKTSAVKVIST
jgi:molybdopterin-binding protein